MTRPTVALPAGFRIVLDPGTKQLADDLLFGGSPARVMRLSGRGLSAWRELRAGPVRSAAAGALARQLTDAGIAHPRPPRAPTGLDVTVLVPVRNRTELLDRCLGALGARYPVVVVDDASADPRAVARVAARHGATVVGRAQNGGPGAARNTGLAHIRSDVVAFVDSDCLPPSGWIEMLATHLADPLVAAVAPRVVAEPSGSLPGRFSIAIGSLDLGDRQARVVPTTRVAYVPTAALIVRRNALAADTDVFDPALRYGEDVDLIWRLHSAGWRIRYDASVEVQHREPATWRALLARRFRYGTSAAPLAIRHPTAMAPLVLHPWPALAVAGLLARRPAVAALGFAASVATMARTLRRAGVPTTGVGASMATAAYRTWLGIGRYGTQFASPLIVAVMLGGGPAKRRLGRRIAVASLLLGPPLTTWAARRPALDPIRFTAGHVAEDIAYGAGVWAGCIRNRCFTPLRPIVSWHPLRTTSPPAPK